MPQNATLAVTYPTETPEEQAERIKQLVPDGTVNYDNLKI